MRLLLTALILLASTINTYAFEWKTRNGDTRLSEAEVHSLISGKTVKFSRGGWTIYDSDGNYRWKGRNNGSRWNIRNDGAVCAEFPSGGKRCDLYVRARVGIVLINARGKRFTATIR